MCMRRNKVGTHPGGPSLAGWWYLYSAAAAAAAAAAAGCISTGNPKKERVRKGKKKLKN